MKAGASYASTQIYCHVYNYKTTRDYTARVQSSRNVEKDVWRHFVDICMRGRSRQIMRNQVSLQDMVGEDIAARKLKGGSKKSTKQMHDTNTTDLVPAVQFGLLCIVILLTCAAGLAIPVTVAASFSTSLHNAHTQCLSHFLCAYASNSRVRTLITLPFFIGMVIYGVTWIVYLLFAQHDRPPCAMVGPPYVSKYIPFVPLSPVRCLKVTKALFEYACVFFSFVGIVRDWFTVYNQHKDSPVWYVYVGLLAVNLSYTRCHFHKKC